MRVPLNSAVLLLLVKSRAYFHSAPQRRALQTLYMLRQIRPSVRLLLGLSLCLSVTLRYCVKTRERRGMRSSLSGSPVSLAFWRQEWFMGPVQVQFPRKRSTPCENSLAVHISIYNSGKVTDSEESSINANRKSIMGFQTSHQPRSCITPNFP